VALFLCSSTKDWRNIANVNKSPRVPDSDIGCEWLGSHSGPFTPLSERKKHGVLSFHPRCLDVANQHIMAFIKKSTAGVFWAWLVLFLFIPSK
jgi:hypothetical protein